jgi:hypothetical protein
MVKVKDGTKFLFIDGEYASSIDYSEDVDNLNFNRDKVVCRDGDLAKWNDDTEEWNYAEFPN